MIKPNGKDHTISYLKGLIPQTQLVLPLMAKNVIPIPLVLGLEERESVLGRVLQRVQ